MKREIKIVLGGLVLTIVVAKIISLLFGIAMTSPLMVALSLVAGAIIGDKLRTDQ